MLASDNFKTTILPLLLSASGVIGTAAATVNQASSFNITATAAGLAFTLPAPSETNTSDRIIINNVGTNSFTINGQTVLPNKFSMLIWNGTSYNSDSYPQSGSTFIDVALATPQAISAAFTTVNFQTVTSNPTGAFNPTTSFYTVPSNGVYQITGTLRSADGTLGDKQWGLGVHTSNIDGSWFLWHAVQNTTSGSNRTTYPYIRVASFNTGDQLRMFAYSDSGPVTFIAAGLQIIKISE
jgi:hypothetical protein